MITLKQIKTYILAHNRAVAAGWTGTGQRDIDLANAGLTLADLGPEEKVEDRVWRWRLAGIGTLVERHGKLSLDVAS